MSEWLLMTLVGLGVACGLFPLLLLVLRRTPTDDEDNVPPLFGDATEPLGQIVPVSAEGRRDLQQTLMAAGYYHRTALAEFLAIRTALTIAPLFITAAVALWVDQARMGRVLIVGLIATLLGFSLPRIYVEVRRRRRARQIAAGLPLAIDLLTLCLTAGQNLLASLKQVAHELRFSHPVLSQELRIAQKQADLHSLDVAMKQWSDRVQVPEVSNLALLLIQSEKLGTDTSTTLVELSNNFRQTARQRAETQANRTSFWMLFPSVFCFWVAAAIILIGPAYLEFFDTRKQSAQFFNQSRNNINRANNRPGATPPPVNP